MSEGQGNGIGAIGALAPRVTSVILGSDALSQIPG